MFSQAHLAWSILINARSCSCSVELQGFSFVQGKYMDWGRTRGGGGGRGVGVDDWNGIVNQLNVVLLPWELAQFVKTVLVLG